jgi:hypothetical protein
VGRKEEDFYLIREILERMRTILSAELDHAYSIEEAKAMLEASPYGRFFSSTKLAMPRPLTF